MTLEHMSNALGQGADVAGIGTAASFGDVPAAAGDAVLDPYWVELRGGSLLPTTYMPPSMPGKRSLWQRTVAVGVVAMFLGATAAGVCLTYGPPLHGLW